MNKQKIELDTYKFFYSFNNVSVPVQKDRAEWFLSLEKIAKQFLIPWFHSIYKNILKPTTCQVDLQIHLLQEGIMKTKVVRKISKWTIVVIYSIAIFMTTKPNVLTLLWRNHYPNFDYTSEMHGVWTWTVFAPIFRQSNQKIPGRKPRW